MSKAIHILLIDDLTKENSFIKAFQNKARDFGIKITHFERGKLGLEELRRYPNKYKALIFDARCIWDESQQFPDDKFLTRAVAELERLEKELCKTYPTVVNTGYIEDYQQEREFIVKRHGEIFEKATDDESKSIRIFEFLKDKIENSEEWKFADVLDIAETHLPPNPTDFRKKLLGVLKDFENPAKNESVLQDIRVIQDEIYKALETKKVFSVGFKPSNNSPSFLDKNKHLSGNEVKDSFYRLTPTTTVYQTITISYLASSINKICSSFGNHSTTKPKNVDIEYWEAPSNYAVKSLVFALLEQLLWLEKLMERL